MAKNPKNIWANPYSSSQENLLRQKAVKLFKKCPIPDDQIFSNLGLFLNSKDLSRMIFMDFLYRKIINLQGVIFDFGTRWGHNMAIFAALRGIYEPFNRHKKIIGFDTFAGFPKILPVDGKSPLMKKGNLAVSKDYVNYLTEILEYHEKTAPLSHIKKYEIIAGDAKVEIKRYFKKNPYTIVALAYFDFDLYEPTKKCLLEIKPRLVKGSILAFDELNDHDSPGETLALQEVFGLNNIKLKRYPYTSRVSYFIYQ